MNDYFLLVEVADRWDISRKRVAILCRNGRIEGAVKLGNMWAILETATKPADMRVKSGQYRDWRKKYSERNQQ